MGSAPASVVPASLTPAASGKIQSAAGSRVCRTTSPFAAKASAVAWPVPTLR